MGNLKDVSVGDKIYYNAGRYGKDNYIIETVTRVTQTQVVCGKQRFKKNNGLLIGSRSTWDSIYAYKYDKNAKKIILQWKEKIHTERQRKKIIDTLQYGNVPTSDIKKISEILGV